MTSLKLQAIQTALTGDWKNAISLNKKLLDENPHDIDTLNRLALAYAISGKPREAKVAYQKVLDIDPLNPIALKNAKKLKEKSFSINKIGNELLIECVMQFGTVHPNTGYTLIVFYLNSFIILHKAGVVFS